MEATIKNPNKRVNVISLAITDNKGQVLQQPGMLMRTTRSYAAQLVANGTHRYTTKRKLHSFLNKDMKLHKTSKVLETMVPKLDKAGNIVYEKATKDLAAIPVMVKKYNLDDKEAGHIVYKDPHNGKTYVGLKKGEFSQIFFHKEKVDPATGKPMEVTKVIPLYELRVVRFPVN